MADIEIILTSPSRTANALVHPPRRLSIPTILKPSTRQRPQQIRRPSSVTSQQKQKNPLLYHLNTLFLFTRSDLKNILVPQTFLGVVTALSCSQPTAISTTLLPSILSRLPLALAWVWLHLLVFNTSNQTQPSSQCEDRDNKPWRPLPSNRLTHSQARGLFYTTTVLAILLSTSIGGTRESLTLMFLYILNNDLSLGDTSPFTRNVLNAAGYTTFALGAIAVLTNTTGFVLTKKGYLWLGFLFAVIATTGQCQDLEDQEGDRAKDRKTIPLVFGDGMARLSVALPVLVWTVAALKFWGTEFLGSASLFVLAAVVVRRLLRGEDVREGYKVTFRLWNCWLLALYLVPLFPRRM